MQGQGHYFQPSRTSVKPWKPSRTQGQCGNASLTEPSSPNTWSHLPGCATSAPPTPVTWETCKKQTTPKLEVLKRWPRIFPEIPKYFREYLGLGHEYCRDPQISIKPPNMSVKHKVFFMYIFRLDKSKCTSLLYSVPFFPSNLFPQYQLHLSQWMLS